MFYMNLLSSNSSFTRTKCGASRCRANTVKMPFSKLTIMFFLCLYLFRNSAAPKYPPATRWVVLLRLCLCRQGGTVKLWFLFFFFLNEIDTQVISFQLTYYSNNIMCVFNLQTVRDMLQLVTQTVWVLIMQQSCSNSFPDCTMLLITQIAKIS